MEFSAQAIRRWRMHNAFWNVFIPVLYALPIWGTILFGMFARFQGWIE